MAATITPVSIERYLKTVYRPEREYVNGAVLRRTSGEWDHGQMQMMLAAYLYERRREWNVHLAFATKVRVKPDCVRVPDVCAELLD